MPTGATGNSFIAGLNNGADNTGSVGGDLMLEIGSTVLGSRDNGDLTEPSISLPLGSSGGILFSVWGDTASRWFPLTSPNFSVSKDLQFSRSGLRIQSGLGISPRLPKKTD